MKYFLVVLIYSHTAFAALSGLIPFEYEDSEFTAGVVHIPINSGYRKLSDRQQVNQVCQQLTSSFTEDIYKMNESYKQLRALVDKYDYLKIHELKIQIDEYTERITKASNPKWNSEIIPIFFDWNISPHFLPLSELTKIYIEKVHFKNSYFLNKENLILEKDILIWPNVQEERGARISYIKDASILEACQFLRTVQIVVNVEYSYQLLGRWYFANKDLTLEIH